MVETARNHPRGPDSQAEEDKPKEGAQSKVFDHGEFVLKVPVAPDEMLAKARLHPWFQGATFEEIQSQYAHGIEHHQIVERYLATCPELRRLCADFQLLEGNQVKQRKVAVLDYLGDKNRLHQNEGELRKLIDDFATLHLALWRHGACELECSALTNCGRDPRTGELLLIDVGNLSLKFEEALESVGEPLTLHRAQEYMRSGRQVQEGERLPDWFKRGQLRQLFFDDRAGSSALFDYYVNIMSATLTQEALKAAWNSASQMA